MPKVIQTPFDGTIEEDVQLEQIDGKPPAVETVLANAENVYKSFLYLRKMYSVFPRKIQTVGSFTGNSSEFTKLEIPTYVNRLVIKNTSTDKNLSLRFDGEGEYVLFPLEKETIEIIPTTDDSNGTTVEFYGNISVRYIIEQEF